MNIDELAKQIHGKRRTTADLARFISTRTDQNPNYTILLGAGCSSTSGIRTADELIREWRNELCPGITDVEKQRAYLKEKFSDWYDPGREYSSLFEKKYDLQRQRRMFVEKEVASKTPSLGYAYLTALVNQNYFNTLFTTNFDDLINEAFYLYSDQRPIVCAHDSSINSVTVTSKRPKIIKLHGDYLFDDLKATIRETESLEQNMKAKFSEFAKDYGLIVVGYAGSDRSIMDALGALLKNDDYFKSGIYWCLRKGSDISEELRKLLWKEKMYFVEIEGFDELFAELYATFNAGEVLPISTISVTRRPTEIVSRLLENQGRHKTESPTLKKACEQLARQSKRTTLMSMMLRLDKDDAVGVENEGMSDDELITQVEIQRSISSGNYREAIQKGRSAVTGNLGLTAKQYILNLIVRAHRYAGELAEAIAAADELIALQAYAASPLLLKSDLLLDHGRKLAEVEKAIAANPYYARCYLRKAQIYEQQAQLTYGEEQASAVANAHKALDIGISRDPSVGNPCWNLRFDLINAYEKDKDLRDKSLDDIIQKLSAMNPEVDKVLSMKVHRLSGKNNQEALEEFIRDIERIKRRNPPSTHAGYDEVQLNAIAKGGNTKRTAEAISAMERAHDLAHEADLAVTIAKLKREQLGLDDEATSLLRECVRVEFDVKAVELLLHLLIDGEKLDEAEETFKKWSTRLSSRSRNSIRIDLLEQKKDFDGALIELAKQNAQGGMRQDVHQMYLLLRKGAYAEVESLGRSCLERIHFSLEAEGEIVNYELACKHTKSKVNVDRLTKLLEFTDTPRTKAAVYALLNKKKEMIESIATSMETDKSFRFDVMRWPVFSDYRGDPEFMRVISLPKSAQLVEVPAA